MRILLILFATISTIKDFGQIELKQNPGDFLPEGFVILQEIKGDLNKDKVEDCVLFIKGADKNEINTDEHQEKVDRTRRGIIVLFKKTNQYALAAKNYNCFSSEDGHDGVYYAPELYIEVKNGNLYINYGHGRYGYWKYTFRFRNSDFELIGYDAGYKSSYISDWITFDEESINFLSKKKLTKAVINVDTDGKETYKSTWKDISVKRLTKLSEITDFDELDMTIY